MPKEADEIRDLERKWAQNPDSMIFVQLADAYRRSGDLERSVESCLKGLARHPTYATARIILGRDYFDLGKWDEAAAEFRRVEAVDPDNILVHRMMGQIALRQGRTTEAISRQQRVLALDPDDSAAQDLLRQALLQAKQPEGPATVASKAAPVPMPAPLPPTPSGARPEPVQAPVNHDKALKVADIYAKKRAWDQAEEVLSEILALSPGYGPALERQHAIAGLRSDEEMRRKAAEETKLRADEEAKRKADEEMKRKADEEAKRKADEEAKRKADEETKRKADEETKRKADEETKRKAAEETQGKSLEALRQRDAEAKRGTEADKLSATEILATLSGSVEELVDDEPIAAPGQSSRSTTGLAKNSLDVKSALRDLAESVEGALAAGLVGMDGLVMDRVSLRPGVDIASVGAEYAGLLKGALKASRDSGLGRVGEVLVTSAKAIVLMAAAGDSAFVALALDLDGNLGRGRLELKRRAAQIGQALA